MMLGDLGGKNGYTANTELGQAGKDSYDESGAASLYRHDDGGSIAFSGKRRVAWGFEPKEPGGD